MENEEWSEEREGGTGWETRRGDFRMRDAREGQEGMYRKGEKGREGQERDKNRVVWDRYG